jgi:flagellar protein FliO/FliZ
MTLDPESLLKFAAALAFVVALIAGVAWIAKRFVPGAGAMSSAGRKRRLQTVEILPLDSKTRAVLLRRDDTEHLVVIGPDSLAVVETIRPPQIP